MPIRAEYAHINLIARDWKKPVRFYSEVFGCEPKPPERDMSGAWLDQLTSLQNARLSGVHLRLPGYGDNGPTLEVFNYNQLVEPELPSANQCICGGRYRRGVAGSDCGWRQHSRKHCYYRSRWRRCPSSRVCARFGNIVELQKWS